MDNDPQYMYFFRAVILKMIIDQFDHYANDINMATLHIKAGVKVQAICPVTKIFWPATILKKGTGITIKWQGGGTHAFAEGDLRAALPCLFSPSRDVSGFKAVVQRGGHHLFSKLKHRARRRNHLYRSVNVSDTGPDYRDPMLVAVNDSYKCTVSAMKTHHLQHV